MADKPKRTCPLCGRATLAFRRRYCDPCLKAKRLAVQRETHRKRYQTDPEFAERKRQSRRAAYWKKSQVASWQGGPEPPDS